MDASSRRWIERWQALRGPISFGFGASLLIYEAVRTWTGKPLDGELVIAATGFCGLPMFAPLPQDKPDPE